MQYSAVAAAGVFALIAVVAPGVAESASRSEIDAMIAKHAAANNVPAAVVHRVVLKESRYNASAIGRGGAMGLMQIKHATARGLGYRGTAAGLLDPDTNLTYGVRYLAGAYRVAGGNGDLAWSYYRSGYYYHTKRHRSRVAYSRRSRGTDASPFTQLKKRMV